MPCTANGGRTPRATPLSAELAKLETPFARAEETERAWQRNAAWLERQINEPVFGETFGLAQIYVPLRAWCKERERTSPGAQRDREMEAEPREHEHRIVVDLEGRLDDWLNAADRRDPIRVICGGPGSGKTTSAKMWAARLVRDGQRVLYVPLHRLDIRDEVPDVQAMLREFVRDLDVLPHDPLDAQQGEPHLVILFDGLDELAMQGRAGQEVARSFADAVRSKIDRLNDRDGRLVRAVFGGRDIAVEAARFSEREVLHVLPYHGTDPQDFDEGQALLTNQGMACNRWWRQFGDAIGESYTGVPHAINNRKLSEITAQPLLNYLLALSFRRGTVSFAATPNLNLIYKDLLDCVYQRRWSPGHNPARLSRAAFNALLEELGLAAWQGASHTVSEAQVVHACGRIGLTSELARTREGTEAGAISLLDAFYFHQAAKIGGEPIAEGETEPAFEFTHKSLREYLTARRIVRLIEHIHKQRMHNRARRQRGWSVEQALVEWIKETGPSALNQDLMAFLEREMGLRESSNVNALRITFAELISDQLNNGLPMHSIELPTYHEMARQARNAEETLLAAHYACAAASTGPSSIEWPHSWGIRDLLCRLDQGQGELAWRTLLGGIAAPKQVLTRTNLAQANLAGANLEEVDLTEANLKGANLKKANLKRANLKGANLEGADLSEAALQDSNLSWAKLVRANLSEASLENANLLGVDLFDASIVRGRLMSANLAWATLHKTRLTGSNLVGSNLQAADLRNADLEKVTLKKADLRGARNLNTAFNLIHVRNWGKAKVELKWVEHLKLDAGKLGIEVIENIEDS